MSDMDDDVLKPIKRISSQKISEKLELIEKKINELLTKPKPVNKPMDKDRDAYKNKRNVYVNKLNNKELNFQRKRHLNIMKLSLTTKRGHIRHCIFLINFSKTLWSK